MIQTFMQSLVVYGATMVLFQLMERYVKSITIPEAKQTLAYILLIILYVLFQIPELFIRLENIDKGKGTEDNGGPSKRKIANKDKSLPPAVAALLHNPEYVLLNKEYKRKKTSTVIVSWCLGIAMMAGLTSSFFMLFVYEDAIFYTRPVPMPDQILTPIMIVSVMVFYTMKVVGVRLASLDKYYCSKISELKEKENKELASEQHRPSLGFPTEIMDENNRLIISMAAFVRYCVKNGKFEPYTIEAWRPIEGKVFNDKDRPLSAKQLAQSYQDQLMKGTITPPHIN